VFSICKVVKSFDLVLKRKIKTKYKKMAFGLIKNNRSFFDLLIILFNVVINVKKNKQN
jgi:hypothetical protein